MISSYNMRYIGSIGTVFEERVEAIAVRYNSGSLFYGEYLKTALIPKGPSTVGEDKGQFYDFCRIWINITRSRCTDAINRWRSKMKVRAPP